MSEVPSLNINLETVREVAQLLRESELGEICIETTGEDNPTRLRLRRGTASHGVAAPGETSATNNAAIAAAGSAEEAGDGETNPAVVTINVTSPAVGVYRPAKTPVKIGDTVRQGQVVGAVESMRVPTDVTSPAAGRVLELNAADGQGVEYGQVLFVVEEAL